LKVLTDKLEVDNIFSRVEWPTLIFFASLFVVMESLAKLGFLNWIGQLVERAILSVGSNSRI
jgi:Na+/H+ antiporter NhaD/arsenite permease-like protein